MFLEIVEYEKVIDKIKNLNLTESQINILVEIISNNLKLTPLMILEIAGKLSRNNTILFNSGIYSLDPILNESKKREYNLLEFALPPIMAHIPKAIMEYLTESHIKCITEKIFDIPFDKYTSPNDLKNRINEVFSSGDISIPLQGLRNIPISSTVVLNGIITQKLHKGIQFGEEFHKNGLNSLERNRNTLRNALKDFNMIDVETPLSQILPKFIVVLKNLGGI